MAYLTERPPMGRPLQDFLTFVLQLHAHGHAMSLRHCSATLMGNCSVLERTVGLNYLALR
jgi:hypothetical protein